MRNAKCEVRSAKYEVRERLPFSLSTTDTNRIALGLTQMVEGHATHATLCLVKQKFSSIVAACWKQRLRRQCIDHR